MKRPILTIISPGITSRNTGVFVELQKQIDASGYDVELLVLSDNCRMPIGDKVCKLNHMASGDYIIAVGDDDDPRPDYVLEVCKAITENPGVDVVTFNLAYHANGKFISNFIYGLGRKCISPESTDRRTKGLNRYGDWADYTYHPGDVPHSRCAIRREIVQAYYYPEGIWYPEDYIFRDHLRDNNCLKTEAHIDKVLYDIRFEREKRYDCDWKRRKQVCYNKQQEETE